MEKILLIAFLCTGMISCKKNEPKKEVLTQDIPLPTEVWASGCTELSPFGDAFRISGICCAYVLLPAIKINQKREFKLNANLYSYDGVGGYAKIPTQISGELSVPDSTLTLRYSAGGRDNLLTLKPGKATEKCDCGCF